MMIGTEAYAPDRPQLTDADEWFTALDRRVIGKGHERWVAAVLRVHADDREWWIDVATATDPSVNVVLRLSRRATIFHALAALRRWRPKAGAHARVIDVMRMC